jgi:hypothetical protein
MGDEKVEEGAAHRNISVRCTFCINQAIEKAAGQLLSGFFQAHRQGQKQNPAR